ncbi:MAG: GAF domain-containing protein [Gammaproteobacteria bacterium]|nr:GAF domain-containing protein [Gammaproteobacteria bacterium]NIR84167.1 GAF domain-containing protein [Gammaproteobacteria bacterium]NIR89479.1 GAF domain-containing protein [Gammaproteobacteria bacterium]NIU05322.1 GAF domain-containing protein [Gammaproteobacteria bacterium]NIV52262.1 GAF domain-containing protein [Gammaproteobacteria bacterium]
MARSPSPGSTDPARLEAENDSLRLENRALRRFVESMQGILHTTEPARAAADICDVLHEVLIHAMRIIDAEDGSLLVLEEGTQELVFAVTEGRVPAERLAWRRLPAGEGIAGWVATRVRAVTVNNPREDDRFYAAIDTELDFRTHSILAAPLIGGGSVLGVIEALNKREGQLFSATDQLLLTLASRLAGELLHSLLSGQALDTPSGHAANEDSAVAGVGAVGGSGGPLHADAGERAHTPPVPKPAVR